MHKKAIKLLSLLLTVLLISGCAGAGKDEYSSVDYTSDCMQSEEISEYDEQTGANENKTSAKKTANSGKKNNATNKKSSTKTTKSKTSAKSVSTTKNTTVKSSAQTTSKSTASNSSKGKTTASSSVVKYKQASVYVNKKNISQIKMVGCSTTSSAVNLQCTNSSLEFNVNCKDTFSVKLGGNASYTLKLKCFVDGKPYNGKDGVYSYKASTITFRVADNLDEGVHNFKFVRLQCIETAKISFQSFTTNLANGKWQDEAPENKKYYIEALGDSALTGWGVTLSDDFYKDWDKKSAGLSGNALSKVYNEYQSNARDHETKDGTLTYPWLVAEKLGADCFTMARQGAGIATTYHQNSAKTQINASAGLIESYHKTYCDGSRQPDVIIVDAGGTDIRPELLKLVTDDEHKNGITYSESVMRVAEFFNNLKKAHPSSKILWCYGLVSNPDAKGIDGVTFSQHTENVMKVLGGEKSGVYTLKLETTKRKGYPSKEEYEAAADKVYEFIKKIL